MELYYKTPIIAPMLNTARALLPKTQLLVNAISDPRVLSAIEATPRELFVPESMRGVAYVDEELPLAPGRFMLDPLLFARLLEAADAQPHERALDIGCGLGYGAAILSRLCKHVTAVEANHDLVSGARKALMLADAETVDVIAAPLSQGCSQHQPYHIIFIEGAVRQVPEKLLSQLDEGGRLVAVNNLETRPGTRMGLGYIIVMEKIGGHIVSRRSYQASAALLPGFEKTETFRF